MGATHVDRLSSESRLTGVSVRQRVPILRRFFRFFPFSDFSSRPVAAIPHALRPQGIDRDESLTGPWLTVPESIGPRLFH